MAKTLDTELLALTHAQLVPAPDNLRGALTDVSDLADSIAQAGLLQPIRARIHPTLKGKWEIIAGHRRHAAIGQLITDGRAKKTDVWPVVTDPTGDDQARVQAMLIENLQRVDLDPIEEAHGYQRLAKEFGHPVRTIGDLVGVSKSVVSARITLLKLPERAQKLVSAGTVPLDVAAMLTKLPEQTVVSMLDRQMSLSASNVESAVRAHERAEFRLQATAVAEQRGITVSTQASWQLQGSYTREHNSITVAAFKKILLPEDVTGWVCNLDDWNQIISVWSPNPPAPEGDEGTSGGSIRQYGLPSFEDTPLHRVELDVAAWNGHLRDVAASTYNAYHTAARAARPEIARAVAKDKALVAASAITLLCYIDADDGFDLAEQLGFDYAPDDADNYETIMAAFSEWLSDTSNQLALAAVIVGWSSIDTPLSDRANELLVEKLGPTPPAIHAAPRVPVPDCHRAALAFYESLPDNNGSKAEGIAAFTRLIVEDPDNADPPATPDADAGPAPAPADGEEDAPAAHRPCWCGNPETFGDHNDDICLLEDDDPEDGE